MTVNWSSFYEKYDSMSDSRLRECVMNLSDIGSGEEIADVITDIDNVEIKLRLLEHSMELDAVFTESDYARLDGEIPSFNLTKLAKYGNIEFGSAEEVAEAIADMIDEPASRALYERAYIEDVRFSAEHFELMGYDNIDSAYDEIEDDEEEEEKERRPIGCLGFLLIGWLLSSKKKRK